MNERRSYLSSTPRDLVILLIIMIYAAGNYTYFILRFDGNWSDGDTALLTRGINYVWKTGQIVPDTTGPLYENGMNYALVSTFLLESTGIPLQTYQTVVAPMVFVVPTLLLLFVLYRKVTRNAWLATLATFMIYLQPDFLWVTWRGSHEKLLWSMTVLVFFLLIQSAQRGQRLHDTLKFVFLSYIAIFATISTNTFFGSSFIIAMALALITASVLLTVEKRRGINDFGENGRQIRRLLYIMLASIVMLYLFLFYVYPVALTTVLNLGRLIQKVAVMLLNFESGSNPYQYVYSAWNNPTLYLLLNSLSWIILFSSFGTWVAATGYFIFKRKPDVKKLPFALVFFWLLYPAFTTQLAISLFVDRAGYLGANFQVRLFPSVVIVSIPITALGINWVLTQIRSKWLLRLPVALALVIATTWFSMSALLKVTNEPLLSNNWLFYSTPERVTGYWLVEHARAATVWTGMDARLWAAMDFEHWNSLSDGLQFDGGLPQTDTRYFVFSDIERMKRTRLGIPWPYLEDENRVYDNQTVQVFYRRPRTPYQY